MSAEFNAKESGFTGRYSKQVFAAIRMSYSPFAGRIAILVAMGFTGRLLILSNANLISQYADPSGDRLGLRQFGPSGFIVILSAITFTGFLLMSAFRVFFSRLSARAVSRLYDEVTLRTSRLPMRFFDTNPVGRIVTRFSSDYGNVFRLFGGPLAEFLSIIFDLIAMIVLVAWSSLWLFGLFLLVGLLQGLLFRLNQKRLRQERRRLAQSRGPSIAHFAETAQGVTSIRIYDRLETFIHRFQKLNDDYLRAKKRTSFYVLGFSLQMGALTAALLFAAGAVAIWLHSKGVVPTAVVGAGFAFIMLSSNSLQMFFDWLAQFEEAMAGVERLSDYLHRELEAGAKLPAAAEFQTGSDTPLSARARTQLEAKFPPSTLEKAASATIDFQNVSFRYSQDSEYVLKEVSFHIAAGERVGIIGRTGSGKSSLVQALYRFYPVERGRILINGKEGLGDPTLPLESYRRAISYIAQEPTLFKGTLRENLDVLGRHSDSRLFESLQRVELGEWFTSLKHGLSEPIEERGRNLSSGERQLLCMARCLLQDAPIVVLDEATSAIDPATEAILVRATRESFQGKTQLIIAHRLSTLADCDRIIWIADGCIRMQGTPEEILATYTQDHGPELRSN